MNKESFLAKHKKGLITAAILLGGVSSISPLVACSQEPSIPAIVQKVSPESQLAQLKTPLFADADFAPVIEGLKENKYAVTFTFLKDPSKQSSPPFYKYPQTFRYTTYSMEFNNPYQLSPVAQEFEQLGFINLFLSYGLVPNGARTYQDGKVVAEARLLSGGKPSEPIEIEEIHYGADGKPIFKCKSQFNSGLNKIGQTEEIGTKKAEYYFIWPITK